LTDEEKLPQRWGHYYEERDGLICEVFDLLEQRGVALVEHEADKLCEALEDILERFFPEGWRNYN